MRHGLEGPGLAVRKRWGEHSTQKKQFQRRTRDQRCGIAWLGSGWRLEAGGQATLQPPIIYAEKHLSKKDNRFQALQMARNKADGPCAIFLAITSH